MGSGSSATYRHDNAARVITSLIICVNAGNDRFGKNLDNGVAFGLATSLSDNGYRDGGITHSGLNGDGLGCGARAPSIGLGFSHGERGAVAFAQVVLGHCNLGIRFRIHRDRFIEHFGTLSGFRSKGIDMLTDVRGIDHTNISTIEAPSTGYSIVIGGRKRNRFVAVAVAVLQSSEFRLYARSPYGIEVDRILIHSAKVFHRLLVIVYHIAVSSEAPTLVAVVFACENVGCKVLLLVIGEVLKGHGAVSAVGVETHRIGNRSPNGEEVVVRRTLVGSHMSSKTVKCCSGMVLVGGLVVPQEVRFHTLGYIHRIIFLSLIPAQEVVPCAIGSGRDFNSFVDAHGIIVSECIPGVVMPEPGNVRRSGFLHRNINRLELDCVGSLCNFSVRGIGTHGINSSRCSRSSVRNGIIQVIGIHPVGDLNLSIVFFYDKLGTRKYRVARYIHEGRAIPLLYLPVGEHIIIQID